MTRTRTRTKCKTRCKPMSKDRVKISTVWWLTVLLRIHVATEYLENQITTAGQQVLAPHKGVIINPLGLSLPTRLGMMIPKYKFLVSAVLPLIPLIFFLFFFF